MALEPGQFFVFMETAYRNGVMDKFTPLLDESLKGLMKETGMNMGDLFNKMDGAEEETIEKVNRFLERLGFLIRVMSSDRLMSLISRLLEIGAVRKLTVWKIQSFLEGAIARSEASLATTPQRLGGDPTGV